MSQHRQITLALLAGFALAAALAGGCAGLIPPSGTPIPKAAATLSAIPTGTPLGTVEVNAYRGKQLDKVKSEPENSIKGPQHVDIKTYRLAVTGRVKTPLSLTYAQVLQFPAYKKVTTLNCVEGWSKNPEVQIALGTAAMEKYLRIDPQSELMLSPSCNW